MTDSKINIPMVDLKAQYRSLKNEIDGALGEILESGHFILGPNVNAFEREIAAYNNTKYAVGVASGTDAIYLSLKALDIKEGDEIILIKTAWEWEKRGGILYRTQGKLREKSDSLSRAEV